MHFNVPRNWFETNSWHQVTLKMVKRLVGVRATGKSSIQKVSLLSYSSTGKNDPIANFLDCKRRV